MANRPIESSKYQTIVWGKYLVETFRTLCISDNKVIKNSHIGRNTYYTMKKGKQINADAYLRLTAFALEKIRERESLQHSPPICEENWKERYWRIIVEGHSSNGMLYFLDEKSLSDK